MTDGPVKAPPPRLAMAVLVPEPDEAIAGEPAPAPPPGPETDPLALLAAPYQAWIELKPPGREAAVRIDLPRGEPDDSYELLETLYALHGWEGPDELERGLRRALVWEAARMYLPAYRNAPPFGEGTPPPRAPSDPANLLAFLAASAEGRPSDKSVALGLASIGVLEPGLFEWSLPRARTEGPAMANPGVSARVFAATLLELAAARRDLAERVGRSLLRLEREAHRLLHGTLLDAQSVIWRETMRYFTLGTSGVEAALDVLEDLPASDDGKPRDAWGKIPPARIPAELQAALKELTPFARAAIRIDNTPRGTPSTEKVVEAALARARAALAREVGRRAEAFPILMRVPERQMRKAAEAGAEGLGDVIFPLLSRAQKANKRIRSRMRAWTARARVNPDSRSPEKDLAQRADEAGRGESVWSFPKYIERAAARVFGEADDVGRRAAADALAAVRAAEGGQESVRAFNQAAGEMMAMGAAAQVTARLVPVANVAFAAWHIGTAAQDFRLRSDEFHCALDPRDALADAAPSAAGLALDIAVEAAFAVI